jgi:hypothetical protein
MRSLRLTRLVNEIISITKLTDQLAVIVKDREEWAHRFS